MSALYAKAGETVTCENCGTAIGCFCNDIVRGQTVNSADFVLPSGDHPTPHSLMPRCEKCGGRGFRDAFGRQAHFAEGWRGRATQ